MVVCEIRDRCIDFENTVASSYAQYNTTPQNRKSPITTSIWSSVRKFKSDAVPSEI
jgi:hypothetical protein